MSLLSYLAAVMDRLHKERVSACALLHICGDAPRAASGMIRALGSASAVFELQEDDRLSLLGPSCRFRDRINEWERDSAEKELDRLAGLGFGFISFSEDCYPRLLKDCNDAPAGLYIRSSSPPESLFGGNPPISVVGTRDISPYGKEWCPRIVGAIASSESPPAIVSGLAFGVDISAHMAALAYGIPTIAVIPVGIDSIYPRSHSTAADKICSSPGSAVITDYPPGTAIYTGNFLRRNRIIAGISRATILIESKAKGGGTMTARLAAGYGRDVFALPGRIDDVRSAGCNALLGEKAAEPVTSLGLLVEALGLGAGKDPAVHDFKAEIGRIPDCDEASAEALSSLAGTIAANRGITTDELCRVTGLEYGTIISMAHILECVGIIEIDLLQRCSIHVKKR